MIVSIGLQLVLIALLLLYYAWSAFRLWRKGASWQIGSSTNNSGWKSRPFLQKTGQFLQLSLSSHYWRPSFIELYKAFDSKVEFSVSWRLLEGSLQLGLIIFSMKETEMRV